MFASGGIVIILMGNHSPDVDRGVRRDVAWQRADIKASTPEAERRQMGLLVKDFHNGDPIRLRIAKVGGSSAEMNPRTSYRQEEPQREIPLRVGSELPKGHTFAVFSSDGQRAYYFELTSPHSSADGIPATEVVYVNPLDFQHVVKSNTFRDCENFEQYLSEKTKELLKGYEITGVMGGQEVLTSRLPQPVG